MIFFSEDQKRFCAWVREFANKELSEGALERQRLEYVSPDVIAKLADSGLLEMGVSVEYAKHPIDCVSLGIAMEEICKVDYTAMIVLLIQVVVYGLAGYMDPILRDNLLTTAAAGKINLCFANTEPDCGSDAAAIKTEAIHKNSEYIITGEKTSISGGMQADGVFLTAKTDPNAGVKGVSLFYVPLSLQGVGRSAFHDMGNLSAGRASLFFDHVRVPDSFRIGNEGEGFTKVMRTFDMSRVLVSLSALALAEASLTDVCSYVKSQVAFGHKLGDFQGVAFKLAEHATMIEATRMLCYKALKLRDEGLPHGKEAAMTKWLAPKCAVEATHDILLILGHRGYKESSPYQQRWRDAISCFLGDGSPEIMKIIVARELLDSNKGPII